MKMKSTGMKKQRDKESKGLEEILLLSSIGASSFCV